MTDVQNKNKGNKYNNKEVKLMLTFAIKIQIINIKSTKVI